MMKHDADLVDAHTRLQGLIDERVQAIARAEAELVELRAVMAAWDRVATRWRLELPPAPQPKPAPLLKPPAKRERQHFDKARVIAIIREKGGPMHWRELLKHFGLENGKAAVAFRSMARAGDLVNHGDGFFGLPRVQ